MIKTQIICDFCEKPIPVNESGNCYNFRTVKIDTRKQYPHMCKKCADRIDDILKDYEKDMIYRANLGSKFAQINKERKEKLGTEG